ncbi:diguanylate cyclase (GGDEF) domain-containing protein [Paenibacillus sp. 1_12]|uniref:sensor domain-containing diguanylate cyclase n=1 Tax=Paenibacillus sp. 1_12 TaxID=1566278 RepID=UPI0008E13F52|nr:sensor domain-containing diguanylate cyclase [Paenibacillus sp. 1_12]SFL67392.1 diguanylate cyclase (GGDEF) domain-containing protein [Paenibacillus sp. 1_12]
MLFKFRSRTIKQHFLIWSIMIIVVFGLFINAAFYWIYTNNIHKEVNDQLAEKLTLQSLYINRWLDERSADINQIAGRQDVKSLNLELMRNDFLTFIKNQSEFGDLGFVNMSGDIIISAMNPQSKMNVRNQAYFEQTMKGKMYISEVMFPRVTGEPIIIFSSPVYNANGEPQGMIYGSVRLGTISRTIRSVHFGQAGEQYLIDGSGMLITEARLDMRKVYGRDKIDTEILQRALTDSNDDSIYTNYRGEEVIGSYQWTKDRRWIIVAELRTSEVFAARSNIMWVFVFITLCFLVASLYGIVLVTRRVERPLEFLQQGTKVLNEGHYDYRIDPSVFKHAPVELKELCDTFNMMSFKLKSTVRLLEEYALIDALTELHNRRYLAQEGSKIIEKCVETQQPCTIMMIDVDYFKKVNDTYGHQVGDRVLLHIAKILKLQTRPSDLVARYGGEEFTVLAQHTDLDEAILIGEAIRKKIENEPYREEEFLIPLTASVGIAQLPFLSETDMTADTRLSSLAEAADRALYRAKQSGRNRIESHSDWIQA